MTQRFVVEVVSGGVRTGKSVYAEQEFPNAWKPVSEATVYQRPWKDQGYADEAHVIFDDSSEAFMDAIVHHLVHGKVPKTVEAVCIVTQVSAVLIHLMFIRQMTLRSSAGAILESVESTEHPSGFTVLKMEVNIGH